MIRTLQLQEKTAEEVKPKMGKKRLYQTRRTVLKSEAKAPESLIFPQISEEEICMSKETCGTFFTSENLKVRNNHKCRQQESNENTAS